MILSFIVLSYLSLFALGFSDNVRGPLFPKILEAYNLSDGAGAWAFAMASLLAFIGSILTGRALRVFRKVQVLSLACFFMGMGLLGMAYSPNFVLFLMASALFGFSMGMLGVTQNTLVTIGTTEKYRSRVLSGLHAMYGLASLIAPLVVSAWLRNQGPWQIAFVFAAILSFIAMAGSLIWRGPKFEGSPEDARIKTHSEPGHYMAAMILGAYVVTEILVSSRLALYLTRYQNMPVESASLYVTYFFVCLLAGRLAMAIFKLPFALALQLKLSLIGSLVLLGLGLNGWVWGWVLSGLTMAPFYPLAISYISENFPNSLEGAIAKTMAAQGFLVVVMHFSVGYLSDYFGLLPALFIGPLFLVISFVCVSLFERSRSA